LLTYFSNFDPDLEKIRKDLIVTSGWTEQDFLRVSTRLKNYDYGVAIKNMDLEELRTFLIGRREFLVRLLENPLLLEHESITELFRAVFHLTEELEKREDVRQLPDTDYAHLALDIKKGYVSVSLFARHANESVRSDCLADSKIAVSVFLPSFLSFTL
jgi:hypothetical protein